MSGLKLVQRVEMIEDVIAELARAVERTERQAERTQRQAELTELVFARTDRQIALTERIVARTSRQMAAYQVKADADRVAMNRKWGELANRPWCPAEGRLLRSRPRRSRRRSRPRAVPAAASDAGR